MDLRAQHLSETCSDPIEYLRQLRQTTEPIGGSTVYDEDGELVEYNVAIEAVEKANKAFIEKAGDEWKKQQMMKEAVSATIVSDLDPHGTDYGNQKIICGWGELEAKKFKNGSKVKLIIIKED